MTTVKFDGYSFGDRTLEGVYFQADIDDQGKVVDVRIDPEFDDAYWQTLNHKYWLDKCRNRVEEVLGWYPGTNPADIEELNG